MLLGMWDVTHSTRAQLCRCRALFRSCLDCPALLPLLHAPCPQTLVKRAKHGDDSMDLDRAMAANIKAKARFKEADLDADAEYDHDAGLEL